MTGKTRSLLLISNSKHCSAYSPLSGLESCIKCKSISSLLILPESWLVALVVKEITAILQLTVRRLSGNFQLILHTLPNIRLSRNNYITCHVQVWLLTIRTLHLRLPVRMFKLPSIQAGALNSVLADWQNLNKKRNFSSISGQGLVWPL